MGPAPSFKKDKFIKTEEFIKIENIDEIIKKIVKDTYTSLKGMLNKNLEEEYGMLNINAATYIPRSKLLRNNIPNNMANNIPNNNMNYGGNFVNNNDFHGQNYMDNYN